MSSDGRSTRAHDQGGGIREYGEGVGQERAGADEDNDDGCWRATAIHAALRPATRNVTLSLLVVERHVDTGCLSP